jgi:hypothetical protein
MRFARTLILVLIAAAAPARAPRGACPAGAAAAFSWWTGSWNYAVPGYDPGTTTVTASSGGCVLREEFVDVHGAKAHTTIAYDASSRQWTRTVTDPFRTYHSVGTFAPDGAIAFYETPADRETYRPVDHDHVRFFGERSSDGGKSWTMLFDATYTRRP